MPVPPRTAAGMDQRRKAEADRRSPSRRKERQVA
uniref:TetR/AcrR family transcriptional regulator n=1 Tax=Heterorhabditis bacteriophora TaxID=37862 RepID=A0A1I7WCV9_HETBA